MARAYKDVRDYNSDPAKPTKVRSLCWFVDDGRGEPGPPANGWNDFALSDTQGGSKLPQARLDFISSDTSAVVP